MTQSKESKKQKDVYEEKSSAGQPIEESQSHQDSGEISPDYSPKESKATGLTSDKTSGESGLISHDSQTRENDSENSAISTSDASASDAKMTDRETVNESGDSESSQEDVQEVSEQDSMEDDRHFDKSETSQDSAPSSHEVEESEGGESYKMTSDERAKTLPKESETAAGASSSKSNLVDSSLLKTFLPIIGVVLILFFVFLWLLNDPLAFSPKKGENFTIARPLDDKHGPKISNFVQERNLETNSDAYTLINALKEDHLLVGVSNRDSEPLFTAVENKVETQNNLHGNLPEPEVLPWFYDSPNVGKLSPESRANKYALIKEEIINDFTWNRKSGHTYLLHEDKPYTGWYSLVNEGWRFYQEGRPTDYTYNLIESQKFMKQAERIHHLVPGFTTRKIYERPVNDYAFHVGIRPYSYSILFKNPRAMILTSPPGTKGSSLLTTTENFVDLPMEVVHEARTPSGSWLHVYIGYEELGWIKKDVTKTDYVTTYYSERNLLDNIEYTLSEEFENIRARIGGSFVNNDTMSQISVNNEQFYPASTQKIYVLGELYHQYAIGNLSPDTYVTMNDYDKVPGAGVIQGQASGTMFSLNELVDLVMYYSDNTAANLLIDAVGGGAVINPHLHKIGLYDTYVSGKYYHEGTWFSTTPENAARYFALIANNKLNGEPYDEQLINKFMINNHTFLRSQLWGIPGWNKTGLGETERNDVATFHTDLGSYSLAVYTSDPAYYKKVEEQLGYVGYRIYQVYTDIRSQLYQSVTDPAELTGDPEYAVE